MGGVGVIGGGDGRILRKWEEIGGSRIGLKGVGVGGRSRRRWEELEVSPAVTFF